MIINNFVINILEITILLFCPERSARDLDNCHNAECVIPYLIRNPVNSKLYEFRLSPE